MAIDTKLRLTLARKGPSLRDTYHQAGICRTVKIEYRWAEGQSQRYAEIAAEFVRLKVDVIVTVGSAVPAAKQATATIPIVFAAAIEPVESGLVASLAKPGGNVTGFSAQAF